MTNYSKTHIFKPSSITSQNNHKTKKRTYLGGGLRTGMEGEENGDLEDAADLGGIMEISPRVTPGISLFFFKLIYLFFI